ncbi:MAG: hypothetical protein R3F34_19890 [Planctomycetota bacterium]
MEVERLGFVEIEAVLRARGGTFELMDGALTCGAFEDCGEVLLCEIERTYPDGRTERRAHCLLDATGVARGATIVTPGADGAEPLRRDAQLLPFRPMIHGVAGRDPYVLRPGEELHVTQPFGLDLEGGTPSVPVPTFTAYEGFLFDEVGSVVSLRLVHRMVGAPTVRSNDVHFVVVGTQLDDERRAIVRELEDEGLVGSLGGFGPGFNWGLGCEEGLDRSLASLASRTRWSSARAFLRHIARCRATMADAGWRLGSARERGAGAIPVVVVTVGERLARTLDGAPRTRRAQPTRTATYD